ncbi:hypothetical protein [Methylobacter svalbardensis]|uniref:hypothetical protein n=1 Tax=Methylobacter svalbardensis TaxID=3080016 RepID=UPI0030EB5096
MKLSSTKTDSGFVVSVPYELKDDFKAHFKTAKWSPTQKQWCVGPRSGKKLQQWIDQINITFSDEALEEFDSSLMTEKEIEQLKQNIELINDEIKGKLDTLGKLSELKVQVEECTQLFRFKKEKLKEIISAIEIEKAEIVDEKKKLKMLIGSVIDIDDAKLQASIMARYHKNVSSNDKRRFSDAQDEIIVYWDNLKSAGLSCQAINFLSSANKNRPDLDRASFVTEKMWFNIKDLCE